MRFRPIRRLLLFIAFTGIVFEIFGCRSSPPPIVYYTLDPLPLTDTSLPPPVRSTGLRIGLGPVDLPTYLDRTQIVTRSGDHTLAVNDFDRWAGPLDEEILRVLVVAVRAALPGAEVLSYPWELRQEPTYQVRLTLQRFDGQKGGNVYLRGIWYLTCHADPEKNLSKTFEITEAVAVPTMQAVVAAQNQVLAALAGQIIDALGAVSPVHS
ncbi:MAG: PqiC family protein [Desulfosarcinaceae bacterium]|jgi:uncharacterized lipoprotein YmbA